MFNLFKKKSNPATAEPDTSYIVPRLKTPAFLEALKGMNIPADQLPATQAFVGELIISYAFDLPSMFQMVMGHDVERLGLSAEQLHSVAMENLRTQLRAAEIQMGEIAELPGVFQLGIGENLEACTLLDTKFWQRVGSDFLQGEVVVVAPHRDIVLFARSDSKDGIEALRIAAKNILEEPEDNHGLSPQLMIFKNDQWELYK